MPMPASQWIEREVDPSAASCGPGPRPPSLRSGTPWISGAGVYHRRGAVARQAGSLGPGAHLGQVLGGNRAQSGTGGLGGLGALLESLQRAGHGDAASSWVGTGRNVPISPDVIGQVFGQGGLASIARQAGVSERDASAGLSELLPEVVDRVTPNGQMPDLDQLARSIQDLQRRLGA